MNDGKRNYGRYDEAVAWAIDHPDETATTVAGRFSLDRKGLLSAAGLRGKIFFKVQQCGRPRKYQFQVGQQVGRLTVLTDSGSMFEVLCVCGMRRWLFPAVLNGHSEGGPLRNCGRGCATPRPRPVMAPQPTRPRSLDQQARSLLLMVRRNATEGPRKHEVSLTIEDILRLRLGQPCAYCGSQLGRSACLDRMDNARGYHADNVIACCAHCNDAKRHMLTPDEFRAAMAVRLARTGPGKAWDGVVRRASAPRMRADAGFK